MRVLIVAWCRAEPWSIDRDAQEVVNAAAGSDVQAVGLFGSSAKDALVTPDRRHE
jgi:hypothetical protein